MGEIERKPRFGKGAKPIAFGPVLLLLLSYCCHKARDVPAYNKPSWPGSLVSGMIV